MVLHGSVYDEAMARAMEIRAAEGQTLIHPFDMETVIAGQGTIGLELLEPCPGMDVVVVPLGGGGLISGIALAIKEIRPEVRVVGVESTALPAALRAREAGGRVTIPPADTIADGIAVRMVGESTFGLIERYVDELVAVDEEEIASAVLLLLEREKTVAEPAAAASVAAAVYGYLGGLVGKNVVMVLSGGNVDVTLLSRIIERGLLKDGRMAQMKMRVKDRPGALASLTALLAESGANVVSLEHRRGHGEVWVTEAEIALTLETRGPDHVAAIVGKLSEAGYDVERE